MAATYDVLLDGEKVARPVVAFDPAAGWVDVYKTDKQGGIVITDGLPVVCRLTGIVTVQWTGQPA